MYIAPNTFHELHKFLCVDLIEENLSTSCRFKLSNLITKLETYASQNGIPKNFCIYEDGNIYEEPCKKELLISDFNFELPKRQVKCRNDLQNMTLSGPLYYRYNLQCWEHYPSSMLIDGRLICSKSLNSSNNSNNISQITSDNINSPNYGKSSEFSIFLIGYTAVLTWKDCGMNYVFKLTHPTEDTKVFSTGTEEEAIEWIKQINEYSVGSVPSERKIIPNKSNFNMDPLDEFDDFDSVSPGLDNISVDETTKVNDNSHLRRQPSDVLTVINNSTLTNPNFLISDVKFNRSRSSYSFKNVPNSGSPSNLSNSNNNSNTNNGSIASGSGGGGGTSIISSMRRKVESIGNKYRNRKSFAGFSSKSFNFNSISVPTSSTKARTMPQISPDDSRRASIYSVQGIPPSKDIIYSGHAKLRLQGNRSGWMERWCQLKPKLLECYHPNPGNNGIRSLDFALCLENLTLGVSNDKKHRSALRLSCDNVKQDLLFEVMDKVIMGDWIKSFIEALGISNQKAIPIPTNSPTETLVSQAASDDIMCRSLTTIQSIGSDSIYDEVCSSDNKGSDQSFQPPQIQSPNAYCQRRWSSPAIELPGRKLLNANAHQPPSAPYAGRRCLREHPLPSLPASSPDSENNSDTMADTPTGNNDLDVESIYDYSSTFGRTLDHSRTSTLKITTETPTYHNFNGTLNSSMIYADQEQDETESRGNDETNATKFGDNSHHWRVQGCSLADLIARFEPNSENQDHSSATMSSKTDSSCTYHNSSEDNINSISNSFMSVHSFENNSVDQKRKVCRSASADTDLSFYRRSITKNRPSSIQTKRTSLELVLEELVIVKEDIRNLKKQKSELQKVQNLKQNNNNNNNNKIELIENITTVINDITNQIKTKEHRVKELSNHSRKRFTVEIVTDLNRQSSRLSTD